MLCLFFILEIKNLILGSRIGDMTLWDELIAELSAKVCACYCVFFASNTLHNLKDNHANITMQRLLNKFIEI